MFAAVGKAQFAADDEVADGAGGEDLSGLREAHDAGGEVDGESGDVVAGAFDFAGVQSGANLEHEVACVADDLSRTAHAMGGPGEEGQRAVAGRLDRLAAVRLDDGACCGEVTVAEIGEVTRFPTARHLCAWAGLAPTVRSSDGKAPFGHISHQGSPALRWALTEAAQKIPTGGGPLRAMFERIAKRRGRKIAKVAVARQILTLCYYGLRDGEIRCLKHQPIDDHDNHELAEAA